MAKLVKCKECGELISKKAKSCPHCGSPAALANQQLGCCGLITIIIIISCGIYIFAEIFYGSDNRNQPAPADQGPFSEHIWVNIIESPNVPDHERFEVFKRALSGEDCPNVVNILYLGIRNEDAIWEVECEGGKKYFVSIENTDEGQSRILDESILKMLEDL